MASSSKPRAHEKSTQSGSSLNLSLSTSRLSAVVFVQSKSFCPLAQAIWPEVRTMRNFSQPRLSSQYLSSSLTQGDSADSGEARRM